MRVVVWPALPGEWLEQLRAVAADGDVVMPADAAGALAAAPQADGWIGELTPALLAAAPKLRWLQAWSTSLERVVFPELVDSGLTVTNMRHIYDDHVANHTMAMLLALCRDFPRLMRRQARGYWTQPEKDDQLAPSHVGVRAKVDVRDPGEMTALIVGAGGIGSEVARRLAVFGGKIVGVDPKVTQADGISEIFTPDRLPELLAEADAVIVCAPQTPQTTGLFDEAMLRRMRPDALLLNVGRGKIVKLDALERVLADGHLGGAAIDVFEIEPLPETSTLWDTERVIVSPHAAGEPHADDREVATAVENVRRFTRGEPLINQVDKREWY